MRASTHRVSSEIWQNIVTTGCHTRVHMFLSSISAQDCNQLAAPIAMPNKKCFSLEHVARPLLSVTSVTTIPEAQKSVPMVSTLIEVGPRPPKMRRREATAECVLTIFPYTKDAATIWDGCNEQGATLWQVQLEHNARDSITVGFYDAFTKFLQQEENAPDSINALIEAGIKLVRTDTSDPDQVGFTNWRTAFYVAGEVSELHNLLHLLDAFFVWVNQDRSPKVTVRSCFLALNMHLYTLKHTHIYIYIYTSYV